MPRSPSTRSTPATSTHTTASRTSIMVAQYSSPANPCPKQQLEDLLAQHSFVFLLCMQIFLAVPGPRLLTPSLFGDLGGKGIASQRNMLTLYTDFRGHWCPFCMGYLKQLSTLQAAIEARGGAAVAITAEPEEHLAATRKASTFQGRIIIDQENTLAAHLRKVGALDVAISQKAGYQHGMAQPAILVLTKEKRLLFNWAIVPSLVSHQSPWGHRRLIKPLSDESGWRERPTRCPAGLGERRSAT